MAVSTKNVTATSSPRKAARTSAVDERISSAAAAASSDSKMREFTEKANEEPTASTRYRMPAVLARDRGELALRSCSGGLLGGS